MRCSACGFENPPGARFCASCGSGLGLACPHCRAPLTAGARFCNACGQATGTAASSADEAARPAPPGSAERRRVSVLFVDLENFTALAESLDPEEVRTVQSRYFELARSTVAAYGGTIEKFIGDAVMAVWGAPTAHEDDAARAVRAAFALVDAVGRLGGAAAGGSLGARAAVTTGEAAVTVGAAGQGMVAGDLVNVAARLQGRAPVGAVLVDEATRALAADVASFTRVGGVALKGRRARLSVYRVAEAASWPGRDRGAHSGPFVGRDRELRELTELFERVVRDRRSRLVSVTGIAGIGKSRLAWQFGEYIEALPDEVAWHAGRAPAYGEGITFAAVAEMIRRRIGVDDRTEPQLALRQLAATLRELVRDDDERHWMERRIAVLLGREAPAAYDREELFAAWRRFFERVSDRTPAVLVFEDLQWADASLLDFIEHLASWTRDHPIFIVALARPELVDRRPSWGMKVRNYTALSLDRLSDASIRELLQGRDPSLPEALVRQALEHAGGVPLYAVEMVRMLADRAPAPDGQERRRRPRPAGPTEPSTAAVPDSLHGLISARIDALPAPERRLLLAASVLGRRFELGALRAIAGGDGGAVDERLQSLMRRELLSGDLGLGTAARGELGFVQDLVREVAYRTIARSERRDLHLGAARYLGELGDDDVADSLAGHLLEALDLAPDHADAPRISRRAIAALRLAARDAIRIHVPERALSHLERALRLAPASAERPALLDEAAAAARAAGRLELAEGHLRELVDMRTQSGTPGDVAMAQAQLASVLIMGQRNEPALAELEAALASTRDTGADAPGVELASQLARARMIVGDDRSSLEWAERALADAERLGLDALAVDLLVTRGTARHHLGDEESGLADLQRATARAKEAGFLNAELRARNNLAWLLVGDDPRATMATARQGFELATAMGVHDMGIQLAGVAIAAAVDTGDWDWALATAAELEERGISEAFRIDFASLVATIRVLRGDPRPLEVLDDLEPSDAETDPQILAGVLNARAWEAFVAGRFDEAHALAVKGAEGHFGVDKGYQLALATRASLWLGDLPAAEAMLRAYHEIGSTGRAIRAASATLAAGVASLAEERSAAAQYRTAAEAWRELELPLQLGLCLLDEHRLLGAHAGSRDGAEMIGLLRALGADGLARLAAGAGAGLSSRSAPARPAR